MNLDSDPRVWMVTIYLFLVSALLYFRPALVFEGAKVREFGKIAAGAVEDFACGQFAEQAEEPPLQDIATEGRVVGAVRQQFLEQSVGKGTREGELDVGADAEAAGQLLL